MRGQYIQVGPVTMFSSTMHSSLGHLTYSLPLLGPGGILGGRVVDDCAHVAALGLGGAADVNGVADDSHREQRTVDLEGLCEVSDNHQYLL